MFLLFLLFCSASYFAQDIIILKNGNKIYCKIVFEDSTSVYYSKPPQKTQFEIKKSDVEKFIWTNAPVHDSVFHKKRDLILFDFSGGYVRPIDEFASVDPEDIKSGLAKDGYFIRGNGVLKLADNFGFSAAYHFQKNKLNDVPIREHLSRTYGTSFTSSASSWKSSGILGGIFLTVPLKPVESLSFYTNIQIGSLKHVLPSVQTSATLSGTKITVIQFETTARAFTFFTGMGFNYRTNKSLAFNFAVNYFYSKPVFRDIYSVSSTGFYSYDDYTQKITTINAEIGVSFILQKRK
jgi:hypothetical protein